MLSSRFLPDGLLRRVEEDETRFASGGDQAAIQAAHFRGVAGREADRHFCRNFSQRRQHRNHAQNAERLHSRACGRIRAENHAMQLLQFFRRSQREQSGALISVMNDFERARRTLAQLDDLIVGQSRVAAVDVADHVGVGFENHVLVDEAGAGNRRPAGVNRALDAVFAGPRNHAASGGSVFHAAQADLAEKLHARGGEFLEVIFHHALFQHRRAARRPSRLRDETPGTRAAQKSPSPSVRRCL